MVGRDEAWPLVTARGASAGLAILFGANFLGKFVSEDI
jgi:hypothetical protein